MKHKELLTFSALSFLSLLAIVTGCTKNIGSPASPKIVVSPTATFAASATSTGSLTPSSTATSAYTGTPTPTLSLTPSHTPTATSVYTSTPLLTYTFTATAGVNTSTSTVTFTGTPSFTPTPTSTATFLYTATPTNTGCAMVTFSNDLYVTPPTTAAAGTTVVNLVIDSLVEDAYCAGISPAAIYTLPLNFTTTGNLNTQITQVQLVDAGAVTFTMPFSPGGITFSGSPLGYVNDQLKVQLILSPTASGTVQTSCLSSNITGSGIAGFNPVGLLNSTTLTVP